MLPTKPSNAIANQVTNRIPEPSVLSKAILKGAAMWGVFGKISDERLERLSPTPTPPPENILVVKPASKTIPLSTFKLKDLEPHERRNVNELVTEFGAWLTRKNYTRHQVSSTNSQEMIFVDELGEARAVDAVLPMEWKRYFDKYLSDRFDTSYRWLISEHIHLISSELLITVKEVFIPTSGEVYEQPSKILPLTENSNFHVINRCPAFVMTHPNVDVFGEEVFFSDDDDRNSVLSAHYFLTEYFDRLFPVHDEKRIVTQYLSFCITQGGKADWGMVWHAERGCGKNWLLDQVISPLLANSALVVSTISQITGSHATASVDYRFVMIDDVEDGNSRQFKMLKSIVTSRWISTNRKFKDQAKEQTFCNYWVCGNPDEKKPNEPFFYIEQFDRRWWVPSFVQSPFGNTPQERRVEQGAFLDRFKAWIHGNNFDVRTGKGDDTDKHLSAMYRWFCQVDMAGFSPTTIPPDTEEKKKLQRMSMCSTLEDAVAFFAVTLEVDGRVVFVEKEFQDHHKKNYAQEEFEVAAVACGFEKDVIEGRIGTAHKLREKANVARPTYWRLKAHPWSSKAESQNMMAKIIVERKYWW